MQNSTYDPNKLADFEKTKLNLNGKGVYGESIVTDITIPVETHIDLLLTDDVLFTGGVLLVKGGHFEDKMSMQIVHPTYGVVNEFVTDFRIAEDTQKQFEMKNEYPAKLPAGLTLRIKYVPAPIVGVRDIAGNFILHKVLV
jgi:hypothetical protein